MAEPGLLAKPLIAVSVPEARKRPQVDPLGGRNASPAAPPHPGPKASLTHHPHPVGQQCT